MGVLTRVVICPRGLAAAWGRERRGTADETGRASAPHRRLAAPSQVSSLASQGLCFPSCQMGLEIRTGRAAVRTAEGNTLQRGVRSSRRTVSTWGALSARAPHPAPYTRFAPTADDLLSLHIPECVVFAHVQEPGRSCAAPPSSPRWKLLGPHGRCGVQFHPPPRPAGPSAWEAQGTSGP